MLDFFDDSPAAELHFCYQLKAFTDYWLYYPFPLTFPNATVTHKIVSVIIKCILCSSFFW